MENERPNPAYVEDLVFRRVDGKTVVETPVPGLILVSLGLLIEGDLIKEVAPGLLEFAGQVVYRVADWAPNECGFLAVFHSYLGHP